MWFYLLNKKLDYLAKALTLVLVMGVLLVFGVDGVQADESSKQDKKGQNSKPVANLDVMNIFTPTPEAQEKMRAEQEARQAEAEAKKAEEEKNKLTFVGDDPYKNMRSPEEDEPVRVNPEAPSSFLGMVEHFRKGNPGVAAQYADQYVRYMINLMYEVRVFTHMIGEAMIRQGALKEEDWMGVEQYMDIELAQARLSDSNPLKPTHEESMKRVVADPKGQAEVLFFFTLTSQYSRQMAPDVERLWRVLQKDQNVRMYALAIGVQGVQQSWIKEFTKYTGLTIPIRDGTESAKAFRVGFVPALLVIAPNGNASYLKTGQQNFERMYEFVRRVQGKSATITKDLQVLMQTPIGGIEQLQVGKDGVFKSGARENISGGLIEVKTKSNNSNNSKLTIERF